MTAAAPSTQAIDITPGEHWHWHLGGLTLNGDTITATIVAGLIVVGLGLAVARRGTPNKPSKIQLAFEQAVTLVQNQVESSMGIRTAPWVVPFALALFLFILIANWLAVIPSKLNDDAHEILPPPAFDVNLTYALALTVILTMHFVGVKRQGLGYYKHLFEKPLLLFPLRIVEEVIKPVTLALRLFGNIFAGTIMVALIAAMPAAILWAPEIIWKLFDMFIGLIQAFIFMLLTVLYLSSIKPHDDALHP